MKKTSQQIKLHLTLCILLCFSSVYAQQTPVRLISLNDQWEFIKDSKAAATVADLSSLTWEKVNLPHTWNAIDVMDDEPGYYRGIGWYKRKLKLDPALKNKNIFIRFNGANQETEVYVNGKLAGSHIGGYSKFIVPISQLLNYKNDEIEVKVNNRFNEDIAPLSADFTFFGGIYRNVDLLVSESVHFSKSDYGSAGVYISTPEVSNAAASVLVKSLVENSSSAAKKVQINTELFDAQGQLVATQNTASNLSGAGKITVVQNFKTIKAPKLWSPENPYLYRVITKIIDLKLRK